MRKNIIKKSLSFLMAAIVMLSCGVMMASAEAPSITPEPEMLVTDNNQGLTVTPIAQNPLNLAEGATSNWYSTNWPYSYTNTETLAAAIDISGMSYLEFDLYISDYDLFTAEVPASFPFLDLIDSNGVKNRYLFGSQITAAGWNHVKLDIAALYENNGMDYTKLYKYQFGTNGGAQSYVYKLLNFCATKTGDISTLPNPEMPVANGREVESVITIMENPFNLQGGMTLVAGGTPSFFMSKTLDKAYDISGMENIEFDLYISDIEKFQAETQYNSPWGPYFDIKDNHTGKKDRYLIGTLITKSGWNHISLKIGSAYENQGVDYSCVSWMEIGTNAGPQSYRYALLNICATKGFVPGTNYKTAELADIDLSFNINAGWTPLGQYSFASNFDFSSYKYLMFDIYVSDAAIKNNGYNLCMRMFNATGGEIGGIYTFSHIIQKAGWNRVAIDLNHFGYPAAVSKIDFLAFTSPCGADVRVTNFYAGQERQCDEALNSIAVLGDMNYDGAVNFKDFVRTKKNLATGGNVFYNKDLNNDGAFDAADLALFRKYILGLAKFGI